MSKLSVRLVTALRNKSLLHRTYYLLGDGIMQEYYKKYSVKLKRCIEYSKQLHYRSKIEQHKNNSKIIWKTINELTAHKAKTSSDSIVLQINNQSISNSKQVADQFNK